MELKRAKIEPQNLSPVLVLRFCGKTGGKRANSLRSA